MANDSKIDFSLLLANSVHDIKNSLGMLLYTLDEIIDVTAGEECVHRNHYSILRGEASRINNALVHLLGLYKLQENQLSLNLQEINVADFLDEQLASQQLLFDINNIDIDISCDPELNAFFDENLIAAVISNILVNCAKYTRSQICLSASQQQHYIQFSITDNGNGYPQALIDDLANQQQSLDCANGSTQLGLYFSQQIAALHQCKNRVGSIQLSNLTEGGGCFTLLLP
jgi:signal transduction histidine kinase